MKETLKMMKQIIVGSERNKDINELIAEYKETKRPNILAYLYCENYGLIYNLSLFYPLINSEDIASYSLQILDKALITYNSDIKFSTYFYTLLKNRLNTEVTYLQRQKRKIITSYINIDDVNTTYTDDYFSIDIFAKDNKLSVNQKRYCELLNKGYNIKDISQIIGKSVQYLYQENKNIKQKILNFS